MKRAFTIFSVVLLIIAQNIFSQNGWIQQTSPISDGLTSVSFVNQNTGYITSGIKILRTTNGGLTWIVYDSSFAYPLGKIQFLNQNTGFVCYQNYNIQSLFKTSNAGVNWAAIENANRFCFLDTINGWLMGGSQAKYTNNGGITWASAGWFSRGEATDISMGSLNFGIVPGFFLDAIHFYTYMYIYRTTNGVNFDCVPGGVIGDDCAWYKSYTYNNILFTNAYMIDGTAGFLYGGSTIYRTNDAGLSWGSIATNTSIANFDFVNHTTGYAAGTGKIIYTSDMGSNWRDQYIGSTTQVSAIYMINDKTGWAVGGNGLIVKTTSGGINTTTPPVLISPYNKATVPGPTPTLDWGDVGGAVRYRLQLSTDSTFSSALIDDSTITSSQYNVSPGVLAQNNICFWRVSLRDSVWSEFSNPFKFTVYGVPFQVQLNSPANNSINVPPNVNFNWLRTYDTLRQQFRPIGNNKKNPNHGISFQKDGIDVISTYWFELTTDTVTFAGLIRDTTVADTSKTVNGLNLSTSYYWRVKAKNNNGAGPFSIWWKFTTSGLPYAPTLISPVNGSSYNPLSPVTDWTDVPSAINYRIQVSTDSLFTAIVVDDSSSVSSTYTIPGGKLLNYTNYFWRVSAKNIYGWGSYTGTWRFQTIGLPPTENGWYTQYSTDPYYHFNGISFSDSLNGFACNNNTQGYSGGPIYNTTNGGINWTPGYCPQYTNIEVSDIVCGNPTNFYTTTTWTQAALNTNCMVGYAFQQFESIGFNSVTIAPGGWLACGRVRTFGPPWPQRNCGIIYGGFGYNLLEDDIFPNTIRYSNTYGIGWCVAPLGRVYRVGSGGVTGSWVVNDSANFTGAAPADANTAYVAGGTFMYKTTNAGSSWSRLYPFPNASYSDVNFVNKDTGWASGNAGGQSIIIKTENGGTNWSLQWTGTSSGNNRLNFVNGQSGWAAMGNIILATKSGGKPIALLLSPVNGSTGLSLTPTLDWNDIFGSINYRLQVSTAPDFSSTVIDDSTITASNYIVPAGKLNLFTVYYWRVSTKSSAGWSIYSDAWNFKTIGAPNQVVLYAPSNNSVNVPINITFSWYKTTEALSFNKKTFENSGPKSDIFLNSNSSGISKSKDNINSITGYWFEIVTDTNTLTGLIRETTLTDTTKNLNGLIPITTYYWRVKGKSENGWGQFSSWWKFTTDSGVPQSPALLAPTDRKYDVIVTPLFDWSDISGALKYRIQVSAFSNFSTLWIDDSSSVVSQYQALPGVLAYNAGYYWRVKARNIYGWGNYQTPFMFATQIVPPPPVPVLLTPVNGATDVATNPLLDWNDATGALKYRVQVSMDSGFASSLIDDSTSAISQFAVQSGILSNNTTYYWRAAAKNAFYWSQYSAKWKFKTIGIPAQVVLFNPPNNAVDQSVNLTFSWYKASILLQQISALGSYNNILAVTKNKELSVLNNSNNSVGNKLTGSINSSDVINAYWFELATDTVTLAGLIQDTTLTDTTKALNGLSMNTTYYWHVKAHNELGWGAFSMWWKFTTSLAAAAPTLISPFDRQYDVFVTPLFDWSDVAGALNYRIQVSAFSNFSTLWIDDSTSTVSQFQTVAGKLAYNAGYYWRVKTKNSTGWGNYQTPFMFATQIVPPPPVPVLVTPLNGATDVATNPVLDWNDASGALKYRVQLSADSNFSSILIDDSSSAISQYTVSAGILNNNVVYYWRAASKNIYSWSQYSAKWKFKTIGFPAQVILSYPPNNSVDQLINITFLWYKPVVPMNRMSFNYKNQISNIIKGDNSDIINSYWFEIVTDTVTLAGLLKDTTLTDTSKAISGLTLNTTYYWHVKAHNDMGWGAFSSWWKFTTSNGVILPPILLSPANNSWNNFVTPLLDWSDIAGALKYRLQVSAFNNFSTLWIDDSSSVVSQFQPAPGILAYNSGYYWRVCAKNSFGWGSYQSAFLFVTQIVPPPPVPILVSPLNKSTDNTLTPLLDWNDATGAVKYRLQLSADSLFSSLIIDDSTLTVSQLTVSSGVLINNVNYYWRAASKNTYSWSQFSTKWKFRTIGLPSQVVLFNPPNNSTEQLLNITFSWYKPVIPMSKSSFENKNKIFSSDNTDAISGYWFELVTDTATLAGLIKDSTLTDTTKILSSLGFSTTYYWHVKAHNDMGWGAFSAWWKFTTTSGVILPPVLISPQNSSWGNIVTPLFDWSDIAGAVKYRIQVSAMINFSTLWIDDSSSTISQYQTLPGVLAYNSGYYWRVKAKNLYGWGNYQTPFMFVTQIVPPPPVPVLVSPANGATEIAVTPLLDWNDAAGAVKYRVQLSADSTFSSLLIDDSTSVVSQFTVPTGALNNNIIYYWRTSAKNTYSWSSFSGKWKFRTIGMPLQVTLFSPLNNSTDQLLELTFSWYKPTAPMNKMNYLNYNTRSSIVKGDNADVINSYWFELVTDTASFAGLIRDTTITDTVKTLNGLSLTTVYYWRVKAHNELGWGTFSPWWKFTTTNGVVQSPVLLSPKNSSKDNPVTPMFDWSDAPGAVKYRLQVSAMNNFSVLWIDDSTLTASQYQTLPGILAYNSGYYWRVKAKNNFGWGNYQTPFLMITQIIPPPPVPVLVSPANGATDISTGPVLDWNDASGALKYRVQVSLNSNFSTTIIDDSTQTLSQITIPQGTLLHDTVYWWRTSAKNTLSWSAFSGAWSFRTNKILVPPVLLSPPYNDTGTVVTPLIDWSDVSSATRYRLQVSAFNNFSVLWIDTYTSASNYQVPPGVLAYYARYYWRVKSLNAFDSSNYSALSYFSTKIFPYTANELSLAKEDKKVLDIGQIGSSKAKNITIEISKDTSFTDIIKSIPGNGASFIELPLGEFENYSAYFWRVRSIVSKEKIKYSGTNVFVTGLVRVIESTAKNISTLIPTAYCLYQNYPNPFNSETKIKFDIPILGTTHQFDVKIRIYDVTGREIAVPVQSRLEAGAYEISFDASNYPSGVYFYRLETDVYSFTRKMVLLK